jgi:anti-sigma factor ChrR (cupin superfamily)
MAKPELEFHGTDEVAWIHAEGYPDGIDEKIIAYDSEDDVCTRFLRFAPGSKTTQRLRHEYWEEVYIIEGEIHEGNAVFSRGMYACRPPGMEHGPYYSPKGCMTFEVRYKTGRA